MTKPLSNNWPGIRSFFLNLCRASALTPLFRKAKAYALGETHLV